MKRTIVIIVLLLLRLVANAQIEKPVTWSYAAKRVSSTEALLYLKADIAGGWHIYSVNQKEGGPERTSFHFLPSKENFIDRQSSGTKTDSQV